MVRPVGMVTRGTTAANRLRRVDRWVVATCAPALRRAPDPVVVDLGYGAAPTTTVELWARLRAVRPDVEVVGVEIDPARVAAALPLARPGLGFRLGGFELPLRDRRPVLVRAFNVLRQYDEADVARCWSLLASRLGDEGRVVEGTCDEPGRVASWVTLAADGPRTLTLAAHLATLGTPARLAERLPKALVHRNVPGEPVHAFLQDLDQAWQHSAPVGVFGARQRWVAAVRQVADRWPLVGPPSRWRLGEVTVAWPAVAPLSRRP